MKIWLKVEVMLGQILGTISKLKISRDTSQMLSTTPIAAHERCLRPSDRPIWVELV